MNIIIILATLLLFSGCQRATKEVVASPFDALGAAVTAFADEFRKSAANQIYRAIPQSDRTNYIHLSSANIDRHYDLWRVQSASQQYALSKLKERYSDCTQLAQNLDKMKEAEAEHLKTFKMSVINLKEAAKDGGILLEFEYKKDSDREWGFMVIKDGKIVKREVWAIDEVDFESD